MFELKSITLRICVGVGGSYGCETQLNVPIRTGRVLRVSPAGNVSVRLARRCG